jgi:hypothetical protein
MTTSAAVPALLEKIPTWVWPTIVIVGLLILFIGVLLLKNEQSPIIATKENQLNIENNSP